MQRIEVNHQGFAIIYGENSDMWECFQLQLTANKLSTLKTKINQYVKKKIETSTIIVGYKDYGDVRKIQLVSRDATSGKFWAIHKEYSNERRFLAEPSKFVRWDDELENSLKVIDALRSEAQKFHEQANSVKDTIKHMSPDELDAFITDVVKVVSDE